MPMAALPWPPRVVLLKGSGSPHGPTGTRLPEGTLAAAPGLLASHEKEISQRHKEVTGAGSSANHTMQAQPFCHPAAGDARPLAPERGTPSPKPGSTQVPYVSSLPSR